MTLDPNTLDLDDWQRGTVTWRRDWPGSEGLVSLRLSGQVTPRRGGQYIRLATANAAGEWGVRYLSLASAPGAAPELLVAPVTGDVTPGDPAALRVGDDVIFSRVGAGKLVVPAGGGGTLWLLGAGTGLAPLMSIYRAGDTGFETVVMVHSVRHSEQLAWRAELTAESDAGRLRYLPLVTRHRDDTIAAPRIPALLMNGAFELLLAQSIDPNRDVAILCGGVAMTVETRAALQALGMPKDRVITEF